MKTTVFNLIILDESGSMGGMRNQTISGCNETLNTIRHSAKEHADHLNNLVSIYAFQDGGPVKSRYIVKNSKADAVKDITARDYQPYGSTPLLDAIGSTLTELKTIAATHEDSTGIVTIMTDGYENSSSRYNWQQVASLIAGLREIGWTINLIGANIDVDAMASRLSIDAENSMAYTQTEEGTRDMWVNFNASVNTRICEEADLAVSSVPSPEGRRELRKNMSKRFFKRDNKNVK
ncbi:MAG: VWA domain-containing protein [Muribaculaceae bacterium]|nr:VWA domain-containing protein [Muribaculaceae bacterium]